MAKITILMGRADSGKTGTIKSVEKILGLKREKFDNIGYLLHGQAEEIYCQTGSIQEDVLSEYRELFAQTSSIQEKNKAKLDKVLEETKKWINFLSDKPNAIAIIPFTLLGGNYMEELIIRPLELFRQDNEVKVIYLNREFKINVRSKEIIHDVLDKIGNYYTIPSKDKPDEQAQELLNHLHLKTTDKITITPLTQFA